MYLDTQPYQASVEQAVANVGHSFGFGGTVRTSGFFERFKRSSVILRYGADCLRPRDLMKYVAFSFVIASRLNASGCLTEYGFAISEILPRLETNSSAAFLVILALGLGTDRII
ncbi:hypothetical protein WICPIJ_004751 [Wickerhamomyces pijperi]|uniref:Uncharacterized protein n=1 Tax=Wickerhamomyces pijperi TaxID=599730 RepID=A0A9P8TMZ9_WICPI|nr:hypothetical protein WICPIJ_004751 [Wickerhamomyces pijperi]